MIRNEFQQRLDDDWREFRREVCDFYDRNAIVPAVAATFIRSVMEC